MGHDWVFHGEATRDMNAKCAGNPFAYEHIIYRCSKCGCIRIDEGLLPMEGGSRYKPAGWTWNPFKTLTDEPPCPATW